MLAFRFALLTAGLLLAVSAENYFRRRGQPMDYVTTGNDNTHVTGGTHWPGAYSNSQGAYSPGGTTPTGGDAATACLKLVNSGCGARVQTSNSRRRGEDVFSCTQCKPGYMFLMYYPGCRAGPCVSMTADTTRTINLRLPNMACVDLDVDSGAAQPAFSADTEKFLCTKILVAENYLKVNFPAGARRNHFNPYSGHDSQAVVRCRIHKQTYCQKTSGISVGTTAEASNKPGKTCTSKNEVTCLEVCKLKANGNNGYVLKSDGTISVEGCSSAGCTGTYGAEACDQPALME